MRTIVYKNILKLIEKNEPIMEATKTGTKYTLYGRRGEVILSTYHNNRKIELFIGGKLFASAAAESFDGTATPHANQLYNIERTLRGATPKWLSKDINAAKSNKGATPSQTAILQNAWWKSRVMTPAMCNALGNQK
jgi:hypothetical protein